MGALFVAGYPRSGTTLLLAALGAHSEIALAQNSGIAQGLLEAGVPFDGTIPSTDRLRVLLELGRDHSRRRHLTRLEHALVDAFLTTAEPLTFAAAYELLLPRPDARVWGEKSHFEAFLVPQLGALYPDAAFVHLRRDPRAAILSLWRKRVAGARAEQPPLNADAVAFLLGAAIDWRGYREAEERGRAAVGEERFATVRYEDLVRDTEGVLRRLCALAGVELEPGMLDAQTRIERSGVDVTGSLAGAHRNLGAPIDERRADAGDELVPWARELVEDELGEDLEAAGYAPSAREAGAAERRLVAAEVARQHERVVRRARERMARRLGPLADGDPAVRDVHARSAPPDGAATDLRAPRRLGRLRRRR